MDAGVSQYAAYISTQAGGEEMVAALETGVKSLLTNYQKRNRKLPSRVIIYRDGVSDGQFEQVIHDELALVKKALPVTTKVAIIVCQKRHHTKLYGMTSPGNYVNVCPGILVDGMGDPSKSICSPQYLEFYISSAVAIQGTVKPCKYTLIYDEIGMLLAEAELLSYWLCYTYCRCNRSVSYPTPAYYAHWAAKRARILVAAGGTMTDLNAISDTWSQKPNGMFFV